MSVTTPLNSTDGSAATATSVVDGGATGCSEPSSGESEVGGAHPSAAGDRTRTTATGFGASFACVDHHQAPSAAKQPTMRRLERDREVMEGDAGLNSSHRLPL